MGVVTSTITELIEDHGYDEPTYQMEDCHATYYDAVMSDGTPVELKAVPFETDDDGTHYDIHVRIAGLEDWNYLQSTDNYLLDITHGMYEV